MLRFPKAENVAEWATEIADECMASSADRGRVYSMATQMYYAGSATERAAIHNKVRVLIRKIAGFLYAPTDVRFQLVYDSAEPDDVLERSQLVGEKLSADWRQTSTHLTFSTAVLWQLINGCHFLKVWPDGDSFKVGHVHPINLGVLSESTNHIEEQEAICHESFPTVSSLLTKLEEEGNPKLKEVEAACENSPAPAREEEEPSYLHQMVVGGLQPLGDVGDQPQAAGVVQVFPTPAPWRPQRRVSPTVRHIELWIKDRDRHDWTTVQMITPGVGGRSTRAIVLEGDSTRRNLSRVPGRCSILKIQGEETPGYFWGRSAIADMQMLQDIISQRLRDIHVQWKRNAAAPYTLSGFTSVSENQWYKILNEGGFLSDPNPQAKAQKLLEPPSPQQMEELQVLLQFLEEVAGFSPIMSGQGEPGVRAGVHAQTLVRTSSPHLIDSATRIEANVADVGYMGLRVMQAVDGHIYTTADSKIEFLLSQLPDTMQVEVDSHSASPIFAEDNRQVAIALARAGAVDSEDLIHMLHPPGAQLLLARLKQREKAKAAAAKQEKQEELVREVVGLPERRQGGGGRRPRRSGGGGGGGSGGGGS